MKRGLDLVLLLVLMAFVIAAFFLQAKIFYGPQSDYGFICDVRNYLPQSEDYCLADLNGDGLVNNNDNGFLSANVGQTSAEAICRYDLNGDGRVSKSGDRPIISANLGLCTALPDYQDGSGLNGGVADFRFPRCWDGIFQEEYGEQCDGEESCSSNCRLNLPSDLCGDGVIQGEEVCDCGTDSVCEISELGGETCESMGYARGYLGCSPECNEFDFGECVSAECGNDIRESEEICDGIDLGGQTCSSMDEDFVAGTLSCNVQCAGFDISECRERTADMPDSWLVLYNLNNESSIAWKNWYIQQWGIPVENTLGLNASSLYEQINVTEFNRTIFNPVDNFLENNPQIESKIMGIIVGYKVPGNYYVILGSDPYQQGGGGYSISSNLQNLNIEYSSFPQNNTFYFRAHIPSEIRPRLTKNALGSKIYLTARIDGPSLSYEPSLSLESVKNLTLKAKRITLDTSHALRNEYIYYNHSDFHYPVYDPWSKLQIAVENEQFNAGGMYPWTPLNRSVYTPLVNASFYFHSYFLNGWHNANWTYYPGERILAYAYNSYGATSVRSITWGGRFVPNALYRGQYAAEIGATAEQTNGL